MSVSLILDVLVLVIIGIMVAVGLRRGFFKTIIYTAGCLVSFIISYFVSKILAKFVYESYIVGSIVDSTQNFIKNAGENVRFESVIKTTLNKLPVYAKNFILSDTTTEKIVKEVKGKTGGAVENIGKVVAEQYAAPVILPVIQAVIAILILIILLMILKGVSEMISDMLRRTVFGTADIALGGALGLLQGAIFVFFLVFFVKIIMFLTANEINFFNETVIGNTTFFKLFYNFNTDVLSSWAGSAFD